MRQISVMCSVVLVGLLFAACVPPRYTSARDPYYEPAPTGRYESSPEPKVSFDKFKNLTSVRSRMSAHATDPRVGLLLTDFSPGLFGTFEGQKCCGNQEGHSFLFAVSSSSEDWVFLRSHDVDLLIDGTPFELESKHDGNVGRGYVTESVVARIDLQVVAKMAGASDVQLRIGFCEFSLPTAADAARRFLRHFGHDLSPPSEARPVSSNQDAEPKPEKPARTPFTTGQ